MNDLDIKQFKEARGPNRVFGFMFKKNPEPLFFKMKKPSLAPIHSFFVKRPFLAIWLDEEDKIIEFKIINPRQNNIRPSKPFKTLLEISL